MLNLLDAAVNTAGFADPREKDPSVKIQDGKMFLVSGKVVCIFTKDVPATLAVSTALKPLRNAVRTKDTATITGHNTGHESKPIKIKAGHSTVNIPSKPTDSYPFSDGHYSNLQGRFKGALSLPGSLIHSVLVQAESGLEPSQPELPYTQVVWLTVSGGSILCISGGAERVIKTSVQHYPELEDVDVSINIPRVFIPILDHFVQKEFGQYHLHIDNVENPGYLLASFPGVDIFMELYIPMDEAMQARLSFVASIIEMWDTVTSSGSLLPLPDEFRTAVAYAASLTGDQLVLSVSNNELYITQPKSIPTEVEIQLPFNHPDVPPFGLQARKISSTPGEYFFFYEEESEDGSYSGVRWLVFASSDVCDDALLHFVAVNPLF